MSGTLSPWPFFQYILPTGEPASGYLLFTYAAGSSTKQDTYSDAAMTTPNSNPITLDSRGSAILYLDALNYKFVVTLPTDTDPPTAAIWSQDNIGYVPTAASDVDTQITAGEDLSAGDVIYMSLGDGGRTVGRFYKADADLEYASEGAAVLGFALANIDAGSEGSARISGSMTGLVSLSTGSTYYVSDTAGSLTASPAGLAYVRAVGVADSATTLILSHWLRSASPTLETWIASVGNVGAGEDILATVTVPAATVYRNGMSLRLLAFGTTESNANAKTIRVRAIEGANNNLLLTHTPTVSEAGKWMLGAAIFRVTSSAAIACAQAICGPSGGPVTRGDPEVTTGATLTFANSIEIRVTAEATDDDDVLLEGGSVTLVPA